MVLVVFDDYLAEGNFLDVARNEMERAKAQVPLWASCREVLEKIGPPGRAWRSPEVLEPSYAIDIPRRWIFASCSRCSCRKRAYGDS